MTDERNFLEKAQSIAKNRTGREMSSSEFATEFSKWGVEDRVNYLDGMDRDLKGMQFSSTREAARIHTFVKTLHETNDQLRKIDR